MLGGRSLGSGSFGCVFKPALICKGDKARIPDQLSKVFYTEDVYRKEVEDNQRIARIDSEGKYHIRMTKHCQTNPDLVDEFEDETSKCHEVKTLLLKKQPYGQVIMPYGGVDLHDYKLTSDIDAFHLMQSMKNLFDGLVEFRKGGLVHRDIKMENVMYNPETRSMKFIDFGLSLMVDDVMRNPSEYFDTIDSTKKIRRVYDIYPFDILLLSADMDISHLTGESYLKHSARHVKELAKQKHISEKRKQQMIESISKAPQRLSEMNTRDCLLSLDTYSLGFMLSEMVYYNLYNLFPPALNTQLRNLAFKMIQPIYLDRIHIEDARKRYDEIMSRMFIKGGKRRSLTRRR